MGKDTGEVLDSFQCGMQPSQLDRLEMIPFRALLSETFTEKAISIFNHDMTAF